MSSNDTDVYAAMQTDTPYKTYKKVILGKVYLTVLNPFSKNPDGKILEGNPQINDEGCFYEVWSPQEDVFLRKMNKHHFSVGNIVEWVKKPKSERKEYSSYSEAEIEEIVNSHYLKLQNTLNDTESEAFVIRLLNKAQQLEKSDKITSRIEARLSELQYAEPVSE